MALSFTEMATRIRLFRVQNCAYILQLVVDKHIVKIPFLIQELNIVIQKMPGNACPRVLSSPYCRLRFC